MPFPRRRVGLSLGLTLLLLVLPLPGDCDNATNAHWVPATATWYGAAEGDGSDGKGLAPGYPAACFCRHLPSRKTVNPRGALLCEQRACGYGSLVDVRPLRARVGAVSPVLFKDGEGCGACYKVKCVMDQSICSRRPVTIIITDECPGGYCANGNTHFDLSGAAFGRMAIAGFGSELRNRGMIPVLFRRTPCKYRGMNIAFRVNEGSTEYWLSLLVEFEDGDGDVGSMHIQERMASFFSRRTDLCAASAGGLGRVAGDEAPVGANWAIIGGPLSGPFSVKLTTLSTQTTLSARDVIPKNWSPKATYTSGLNFA
ncbi:unnamed protein product [Spirodela intermedia]|uniref:Uncharacterized protein n=1 Tax=Spirodela intermedia TaxID=51605 RepID=A0A7I8ID27_SPIIN|nr:unnamed protein product [Spirodela intermedia]CAA6655666.1 unnamed protein product [Spirodela intermedia]